MFFKITSKSNTLLSFYSLKGKERCHFQGGKWEQVEYSNNFWLAYWPTFHNKNRRFAINCDYEILKNRRIAIIAFSESQNRKLCDSAIHMNRKSQIFAILRFSWIKESRNLQFKWIAKLVILRITWIAKLQYLRFCDSK